MLLPHRRAMGQVKIALDLGIKVDLLGLGMMAVLKDHVELIPEHHGDLVDLANLPEDTDVYRTLQRADTVVCSGGIAGHRWRRCLGTNQRSSTTWWCAGAIIRPGPIVGKMMHPYMRRRQKKEEVTYPFIRLSKVLSGPLGVPLFQEQLLRMAMTHMNFTGAEAE